MPWSLFRRSPAVDPAADWWRDANAAVTAPTAATLAHLRATVTGDGRQADERDRQLEMLEAIEQLVALQATALPEIATQHRVIGTDRCHLIAPAVLVETASAPGKLFVTSARVIFAGPRVRAWAHHRIRGRLRAERDLILTIAGEPEPVVFRCNSYGDALAAWYISETVRAS
jgi:hypothetical protein